MIEQDSCNDDQIEWPLRRGLGLGLEMSSAPRRQSSLRLRGYGHLNGMGVLRKSQNVSSNNSLKTESEVNSSQESNDFMSKIMDLRRQFWAIPLAKFEEQKVVARSSSGRSSVALPVIQIEELDEQRK